MQHADTDGSHTAPGNDRRDTTKEKEHGQEKGRNKRQAEHGNEPADSTNSAKSHRGRHRDEAQTRTTADAADNGDATEGTGKGTNDASTHNDPAGTDTSMNDTRPTPAANNKRGRLRERTAQNYDETRRRKTAKAPRPRAARERVAAQHLEKHRDTGQLRKLIRVGKRMIDRADQQAPGKKPRRGQVYDDMG